MSEDNDNDHSATEDTNFIVRVRGLPWSTTIDELMVFFSRCQLAKGLDSIHITKTSEGRPSGEAFIELASEDDVNVALENDRKHIGKRYVEVFKSTFGEMNWAIKRSSADPNQDNGENVVKLRGLPYGATKSDIVTFFKGLEITTNGILLTTDGQGRASGEAFVQFASGEHTEKGLEQNKQSMGHRYIEVFRSSMMDAQRSQMMANSRTMGGSRGGPGGGGGGPMMRGSRPGPYDRMGPGPRQGGGPGYGSYGRAGPPMGRNFKNFGGNDDGYFADDVGFSGSFGGGGAYGGGGGAPPNFRHVVRMRGLPFRVTEKEIAEWFSSVADPVDICIRYNNQGKPSGDADVLFATESDARRAMTKHKQNMQHRYVELFYDGPPPGGAASSNDEPVAKSESERTGPVGMQSFGGGGGWGSGPAGAGGFGSSMGGFGPTGFSSSMSGPGFGF